MCKIKSCFGFTVSISFSNMLPYVNWMRSVEFSDRGCYFGLDITSQVKTSNQKAG